MHGEIEILTLPGAPRYAIVPPDFLIIGRSNNADIVLKDNFISKLHCKIYFDNKNKSFILEDLKSKNKTYLNNKPITKSTLNNKDLIKIGSHKIKFYLVKEKKGAIYKSRLEPFALIKRDDKLIGKIAVKLGLITKEDLKVCAKYQEDIMIIEGFYYPLEKILIEKGFLKTKDLKKIEEYKKKSPIKINNYKFQELIGMGGMGLIYQLRDLRTGELRACKIFYDVDPKFEKDLREKFKREAQVLCELNHKNIVKGIEEGEINNIPYIIMEYIDGPTLQQYVKDKGGRLLPDEALNIIIQVAEALEHAYNHNLVHRDIKPDNILLDNNKIVKLCDFGLVKDTQNYSEEEKIFGTAAYMSPEHIKNAKNIDIKSDIYSLGVVFYRILFGKLPFTGDSKKIRIQHLKSNIIFPDEEMHFPKLELAEIIKKMTAKDPLKRYQTPRELIKELSQIKTKLEIEDIGDTKTEEILKDIEIKEDKKRYIILEFLFIILLLIFIISLSNILIYNRNKKLLYKKFWSLSKKNKNKARKIGNILLKKYPNEKFIEEVKENLININITLALENKKEKNYDKAIELLERSLKIAKDSQFEFQYKELIRKIEEIKEIKKYENILENIKIHIDKKEYKIAISLMKKIKDKIPDELLKKYKEYSSLISKQLEIQRLSLLKFYPNPPLKEIKDIEVKNINNISPILLSGRLYARRTIKKLKNIYFYTKYDNFLYKIFLSNGKFKFYNILNFSKDNFGDIKYGFLDKYGNLTNKVDFINKIYIINFTKNEIALFSIILNKYIWIKKFPKITALPLFNNNYLYVCTQNKYCYKIYIENGRIEGAFLTQEPITIQPAINSKYSLIFLSNKEKIYCFNIKLGNLVKIIKNNENYKYSFSKSNFFYIFSKRLWFINLNIFKIYKIGNNQIDIKLFPGIFFELENIIDIKLIDNLLFIRGNINKLCLLNKSYLLNIFQTQKKIVIDKSLIYLDNNLFSSFNKDSIEIYKLINTSQLKLEKIKEIRYKVLKFYKFIELLPIKQRFYIFKFKNIKDNTLLFLSLYIKGKKIKILWKKRVGSPIFSCDSTKYKRKYWIIWLTSKDGSIYQIIGKNGNIKKIRGVKGYLYKNIKSYIICIKNKKKVAIIREKNYSKLLSLISGKKVKYWQLRERITNIIGISEAKGKILFISTPKKIQGFSLISGRKIMRDYYLEESTFITPPIYYKGSVFIGDSRENIYRFKIKKKRGKFYLKKIWKYKTKGKVILPLLYKKYIYCSTTQGEIYKFSALRGNLKWKYRTLNKINKKGLIAKSKYYVNIDIEGNIYCLDIFRGKLIWKNKINSNCLEPIYDKKDNLIYILTSDGILNILSLKNGKIKWKVDLKNKFSKIFCYINSLLFLGSENGILYIIKPYLRK